MKPTTKLIGYYIAMAVIFVAIFVGTVMAGLSIYSRIDNRHKVVVQPSPNSITGTTTQQNSGNAAPAPAATSAEDANKVFDEAVNAYNNGDYNSAYDSFNTAAVDYVRSDEFLYNSQQSVEDIPDKDIPAWHNEIRSLTFAYFATWQQQLQVSTQSNDFSELEQRKLSSFQLIEDNSPLNIEPYIIQALIRRYAISPPAKLGASGASDDFMLDWFTQYSPYLKTCGVNPRTKLASAVTAYNNQNYNEAENDIISEIQVIDYALYFLDREDMPDNIHTKLELYGIYSGYLNGDKQWTTALLNSLSSNSQSQEDLDTIRELAQEVNNHTLAPPQEMPNLSVLLWP